MSSSNRIVGIVLGACVALLIALGSTTATATNSRAAAIGPSEAGACGKCGDGYCNPRCGETATSCPRDCGVAQLTDANDCAL